MYTLCSVLTPRKKRPSVVCGEVNNAIYAMKVVAESYGVVFSDAVIGRLYKELDEHLNRMQNT